MISVTEELISPFLGLVHPIWKERFPWLSQGCTVRSVDTTVYDFGFFSGGSRVDVVEQNWSTLLKITGANSIVHGRQVHGTVIRAHKAALPGLKLFSDCDGHVTTMDGILLTVTTADCVPIFLVDINRRAVAVLHAGWRGTAAGILGHGLSVLEGESDSLPGDLMRHLGPSICGKCYEVGLEVSEALGQPTPLQPGFIDLRRILAQQAAKTGIDTQNISISTHCTRCTQSDLFSHRAGDRGRQVSYIGLRG